MTDQVAPAAPCRLFIYLANKAPVGVVLRRGPSAWARLSVWHTDTDTFEHGQWFRGRVYERRSDVSPDGALFGYFARKSSARTLPNHDTWLAVSRPPFFTSLALWFIGGTYCSGSLFVDEHTFWPAGTVGPPDQGTLPTWLRSSSALPPYVDRTPNWTERTVYFNRLLRDGWTAIPSIDARTAHWERRNPSGSLTLLLLPRTDADFRAYGGPHVVEYAVSARPDDLVSLGRATWADWDHRGRLVIAQEGRLLERRPEGSLREIADFNPQTPESFAAPNWAQTWPSPPRQQPAAR